MSEVKEIHINTISGSYDLKPLLDYPCSYTISDTDSKLQVQSFDLNNSTTYTDKEMIIGDKVYKITYSSAKYPYKDYYPIKGIVEKDTQHFVSKGVNAPICLFNDVLERVSVNNKTKLIPFITTKNVDPKIRTTASSYSIDHIDVTIQSDNPCIIDIANKKAALSMAGVCGYHFYNTSTDDCIDIEKNTNNNLNLKCKFKAGSIFSKELKDYFASIELRKPTITRYKLKGDCIEQIYLTSAHVNYPKPYIKSQNEDVIDVDGTKFQFKSPTSTAYIGYYTNKKQGESATLYGKLVDNDYWWKAQSSSTQSLILKDGRIYYKGNRRLGYYGDIIVTHKELCTENFYPIEVTPKISSRPNLSFSGQPTHGNTNEDITFTKPVIAMYNSNKKLVWSYEFTGSKKITIDVRTGTQSGILSYWKTITIYCNGYTVFSYKNIYMWPQDRDEDYFYLLEYNYTQLDYKGVSTIHIPTSLYMYNYVRDTYSVYNTFPLGCEDLLHNLPICTDAPYYIYIRWLSADNDIYWKGYKVTPKLSQGFREPSEYLEASSLVEL